MPVLTPVLSRPTDRRGLVRITSAAALTALFLGGPLANSASAAATRPPLGTATAFSVLAGSTVTNTGPTTISRSVGLSPGSSVTGATSMVVGGTYHVADAVALTAKNDLTTAYNNAAGQTPPNAAPPDLVGLTLPGGVYNRSAAMSLTGALTLDGEHGDNSPSDSVWVFQAGSTLTTGSAASIVLINGANPCNVYWQVGSSATLGTTTTFVGTIMADQSITMKTGATLQGRALARVAAVNLHNNVITTPDCAGDVDVPAGTTTPPPTDTGGSGGTGGGEVKGETATQVTRTPTGAVDTGYAGPVGTADHAPGSLLTGSVIGVVFVGGLALVAVRRQRRV